MRRNKLERLVVEGLRERLMVSPGLGAFIEVLREERERLVAERKATTVSQSRQRATLERRIAHLLDEFSDGSRSPGIRSRLGELECQLEQLGEPGMPIAPDIPRRPGDLGVVYRTRIAVLEAALRRNASPDVLEAARALIIRVEVHPPSEPGGRPGIAIEASLTNMLRLTGVGESKSGAANGADVLDHAIECSVKRDPGRRPNGPRAEPSPSCPRRLVPLSLPGKQPLHSIESRASWHIAWAVLAILAVIHGTPLVLVVALKPIAADLGTQGSVPALAAALRSQGIATALMAEAECLAIARGIKRILIGVVHSNTGAEHAYRRQDRRTLPWK